MLSNEVVARARHLVGQNVLENLAEVSDVFVGQKRFFFITDFTKILRCALVLQQLKGLSSSVRSIQRLLPG